MIERRISINSRWVLFLFILVVCSTMIQSQVKEVVGKVTYVTDNEFYVDIGKSKGLIIDQRVDVLKDNSPFVSGVIIHISSNSAICTFEGEIAPVIGYTVRVVIKDSAKIPEIKEIKSEGDILILFREELLKIVDPEQQEFIIRILVALIKADNKISKEELNLFNISRNIYTNLNFNDLLLQPSNISSLLNTIED